MRFTQRILTYCFYSLFFLTPLLFTPYNNELFEYNKMMLVYLLTSIIVISWLIKMINQKSLILSRTPLDIPILLFLVSQVLSTIFSIDPHTSIWGYYSRSNGGLLSIISYILLYYGLVSNFNKEDVFRFLKVTIFSGLLVSLYAIPEHFGVSPSCVILVKRFAADCWVQDVQARVFATLGQPNWLAAYLAMLIFPAIYFFISTKNTLTKVYYYLTLLALYLAFTFTYSRGATLGLIGGLAIFLSFLSFQNRFWSRPDKIGTPQNDVVTFKPILLIFCTLLLVNLLFGSSLTRFKLITQSTPPPKPQAAVSNVTQLESGGTESGQIRLIVWKGALEIFKHYPILGSGVETFAYSYYNFRPLEHNLVSEWDFLYNKAHNEYLNYLATTGILGFGTYVLMILVFISWVILRIFNLKFEIFITNYKLQITNYKTNLDSNQCLLLIAILSAYITYLIQNFFGFSVVIIALYFYLFPAFAFIVSDSIKPLTLPKKLTNLKKIFQVIIYRRAIYKNITVTLLVLILIYSLVVIGRHWIADTLYKQGNDYSDAGNPGRAYNFLVAAVNLNKNEPLYRSELGFAAASAALALTEEDATLSAQVKEDAIKQSETALKMSPKNLSLFRTAIRTYYQLSAIDLTFDQKTLEIFDKSIALAPTDPKLLYNKGLVLNQMSELKDCIAENCKDLIDKKMAAVDVLKKAIELKPNYWEAHFILGQTYKAIEEKDKATEQFEKVLKIVPGDKEAIKELEELKK